MLMMTKRDKSFYILAILWAVGTFYLQGCSAFTEVTKAVNETVKTGAEAKKTVNIGDAIKSGGKSLETLSETRKIKAENTGKEIENERLQINADTETLRRAGVFIASMPDGPEKTELFTHLITTFKEVREAELGLEATKERWGGLTVGAITAASLLFLFFIAGSIGRFTGRVKGTLNLK